jgi:hypothetical protein
MHVESKGIGVAVVILIVVVHVVVATVAIVSYLRITQIINQVGVTEVSDIRGNPNNYMGEQVELIGTVSMMSYNGYLQDSSGGIDLIHLPENFYPIASVNYRVMGVVTTWATSSGPSLAINVTGISLA